MRRRLRRERTRQWVADLALWAMLSGFVLLKGYPDGGHSPWSVVLGVGLLGVAVLLCRAWPLVSLGIAVALSATVNAELFTVSYTMALVVFGYLSGRRAERARHAPHTFAAIAAAGLLLSCVADDGLWSWFTFLSTLLFAVVVPWLVGRYVRQYAELVGAGWQLADRMEREQRAVADRERLRERSRIAGDMHDSLGHDLALIAVRAAALEVDPVLDDRQQRAAGEVRQAAADATARLRDIIGVLRADGEAAPTSPAGESVAALVERAADSGVEVTLTESGPRSPLAPMTDRAVYRVTQEALTNAAKHAPGTRVAVRLVRDEESVAVAVVNARPERGAPAPASGGTGLVGLDERVRLVGGTLTHGPAADGGFEVSARLPLAARHTPVPAAGPEAPTSARELDRARRRVRRGLRQAIVAPVAAVAVLGVLMVAFDFYATSRSVLDREHFDRLRIGDTRAQTRTLLPGYTVDGRPEGVGPEPAGAGTCEYYRTEKWNATPLYRLCFTDGRLSDKAVVVDVDNEENRPPSGPQRRT
ncbi:sensor histidine kinase [Streptomyces sp. NPDC088551]|uniref:sensor histidine kinase n=1 Tax=Streptomyces sp. NPDC088551 TaxID=3365863 RepID=UPI0038149EFB